MDGRLATHLEVAALVRRVQGEGGFATILAKGERDAGTVMVILTDRGEPARAFERMPHPDGSRAWACSRVQQTPEGFQPDDAFQAWLDRRRGQDPDLWIIELDIPDGERFIDAIR